MQGKYQVHSGLLFAIEERIYMSVNVCVCVHMAQLAQTVLRVRPDSISFLRM